MATNMEVKTSPAQRNDISVKQSAGQILWTSPNMPNEVSSGSVEDECKKAGINIEHIQKLRQWLDTQPHLPSEFITDLEIILAYHSCNRNSEVTKQVLDLQFTLRTLFTTFFKDRRVDDARVLKALDVTLSLPLEMRAYDNSAVSYHRLIDYDAKKFVLADVLRALVMITDLWQHCSGTWPSYIIIIDLEGITLSHLAKLDVILVQQYLYYLQEAMFVKLKQLHFLNAPSFMDKLLMIIKPFLKRELLDSLIIHRVGSRTIEQYLPLEALPKESGGHFKTYKEAREDTIANLRANEEFFAMESKKRVVESLRPGKPKCITDFFGGIEGSFKKLDID
ncbi:unnamed protein product, partial [Iphiclides podalirius]